MAKTFWYIDGTRYRLPHSINVIRSDFIASSSVTRSCDQRELGDSPGTRSCPSLVFLVFPGRVFTTLFFSIAFYKCEHACEMHIQVECVWSDYDGDVQRVKSLCEEQKRKERFLEDETCTHAHITFKVWLLLGQLKSVTTEVCIKKQ